MTMNIVFETREIILIISSYDFIVQTFSMTQNKHLEMFFYFTKAYAFLKLNCKFPTVEIDHHITISKRF